MDSSTQLKHFVDIAWRRKWWVVVPTLLAAVTSLVLVGRTPNVYRATTTILVTRQNVPESIVRSGVTLRIEERMRSLQLQILSRSYLEQVARQFKMVSADASEAEIAESCRELRARVIPELDGQNFSWFKITVEDVDPTRAAGIANQLAGLFIEQNSKMRATQANGTLEATENWEQKYRLELEKRDNEIAAFKLQNLHELPDQQPANLQLLYSAQSSSAKLTSDIKAGKDRLAVLRAQQGAQRAIAVVSRRPDPAAGGEDGLLATLQRELAELLATYTEENPLVKRKRARIAELVHAQHPPVAAGSTGIPASTPALDSIAVEIATIEGEIRARERERARENLKIQTYGARIGSSPRLQPEFLELTRDSDQAKRQLDIAVVQNEQAQHSQDLEEARTGDQFQIQDRAYPPTAPYSPNVFDYVMVGIALGLTLGVGAAAAREFVDQTVRSEDEFAAVFPGLAVYGVIPSLDVDLKSSLRSDARSRGAGGLA